MYGGRFGISLGRDQFDFFLDSDEKRTDDLYLGKRIRKPDTLKDVEWDELFVYIPKNYYSEIRSFLQSKGLRETEDYQVFGSELRIKENHAKQEYESYRKVLKDFGEKNAERVLFWGRFWQKREYIDWIKCFCRGNEEKYALVSEAIWQSGDYAEAILGISTIVAPSFSDEESVIISERNIEGSSNIYSNSVIDNAERHLWGIHANVTEQECFLTAEYLYRYITETIDALKPKVIFCFGSISVGHEMLRRICIQEMIPTLYSHQGLLPGTISVDYGGEMGESLPSLFSEHFCRLKIDPEKMEDAEKVLKYLYHSRSNRKVQPQNDCIAEIKSRIDINKRTVFFAGQNDAHSHMVPYTEETRMYHSPIFQSSFKAAAFLAGLCDKNGWNFVYKPHPMYSHPEQAELLPDNTVFIEFGDINDIIDFCDVTVTILSSSNYIALIRGKPVVMLGYNQVKGMGCCYEAYEKDLIENTLREALANGFTKEQKRNFQKHIAQLLKYYLYDDLQPREIRYGKAVPDSFEGFYELKKCLEESENA